MTVMIRGMRLPDNCDMCRFSGWSNLHQTANCRLKDYEPCFPDYSTEYREKRSKICPFEELLDDCLIGKRGKS